jgi:chitinase
MRFLVILLMVLISCVSQAKVRSIVYLPSWVNWDLDTIKLDGVDEIKVAFYPIDNSKKITNGVGASESNFDEFIQKIQDLKVIYPKLKVSIVVGGGTYSPKAFSKVIENQQGRKILVESIIEKLVETNFDGVSIDWEYPSSSADKKNFKFLLKDIKAELLVLEASRKNKSYLLSYSIPGHSWISNFINLKDSIKYVDYIEIMSYDLVGAYSKKTGHNANLFESSQDTWATGKTVDYLLSIGIPSAKIVMGIPFYGLRFDNVEKKGDGLHNNIEITSPSMVKYLSYAQIKTYYLSNNTYKQFKSLESNSSYLFNVDHGRFVTFLDKAEVANIVNYSIDNNLYGVMVWHIWQDDGDLTLFKAIQSTLK